MSENDAPGSKEGFGTISADKGRRLSSGPRLDPMINDTIGRRLQAHYKALSDEALPDKFMVLLAQLRAKELKT